MKESRRTHRIIVLCISVLFAILLYPAIVDNHGPAMSLVYTGLGVAALWGIYYFAWGAVWRHFYEKGRRDGERDNSDFV